MILNYAAEFDKYAGIGFAYRDLNTNNIIKSDDFYLIG